jgi:hypothetical protein
MSEWSVGAVGVSAHATAFQGSALNMARILNLPNEFIDHFIQQHKELTSPFPMVDTPTQKYTVADAGLGANISPSTGIGNSGKGVIPSPN